MTDEMIEAGMAEAKFRGVKIAWDGELAAIYLAMRALDPAPVELIERDEPDAFEAWWQNHPNHNRELANYTVKKQIAWDAWWARSQVTAQPSGELIERSVRTAVWNVCKQRGMGDEPAMEMVTKVIAAMSEGVDRYE